MRQGRTTVAWVTVDRPAEITGNFDGIPIEFVHYGQQEAWALVPAAPWEDVGARPLLVEAITDEGARDQVVTKVEVQAYEFPVQSITIPPDRTNLLDPEIIEAERKMLRPIYLTVTPSRLWNGPFQVPVAGITSTEFGMRRSYNGGPATGYHGGTDIAAATGTPVYASASGVVVFSDDVQVRGKLIIIDHGAGLHSAYFHLSKREVEAGQNVEAGDKIGEVGNTGLSTGSHLHWETRVYDVPVDPYQWTEAEWDLPQPESIAE